MEADKQTLYSVLTRTEVHEKMMKEINHISEVFSLSKSDATVIMIRLRWNKFQASDRLGDDKEKLLTEFGLVQVFDSKQNESNSSSAADLEITNSDNNGDYLISTPFCSHKFSTTCWSDYLKEAMEKNIEVLSCLNQDCVASVGPDMVEKLPEPMMEMYESYVLCSFMEGNKDLIKWCPEKDCDFAIEFNEEVDESPHFGVVCLCGYIFCWNCQLESHRPVTCNNASLWLNKHLDQARSLDWIAKNTKPCPNCNSPVTKEEDDSDSRLVTCICGCAFCWVCSRSEEEHNGTKKCTRKAIFRPPLNQEKAEFDYTQVLHLFLWDSTDVSIKKEISEFKAMVDTSIPKLIKTCGIREQDIKAIKESWLLIIQCRQVLKWTYVFQYFTTNQYQNAKKLYLKYLIEEANTTLVKHKENLKKLMHEAFVTEVSSFLTQKVETLTSNTGNYFYEFVKNLEGGLSEVKIGGNENEQSSYWLCDRCSFKNSRSDQECKMCCVTFASASSSSGVDVDDKNTGKFE